MPLYRFNSNSPIDEIKFLKNESGGFRAYLHASETTSPENLQRIYKQLQETGHVIVPSNHQGRPTLEVRGFQTPDGLRATLAEADATVGKPLKEELAEDKLSFGQLLKKYALFVIAGIYLASDWFYIKYEAVKASEVDEKKEQYANEKLYTAAQKFVLGKDADLPDVIRANKFIEDQKWLNDQKSAAEAKYKEWEEENKTRKFNKKALPSSQQHTPKSKIDKFFSTLAGKGYLIGSTTSMLSLLLRGNTSNAETGDISRKVMEAAAKIGLSPEMDSNLIYASGLRDTRSKAVQKFSQYSSEIMNMSFATAGFAIARGNFKSLQSLKAKETEFSFLEGFEFKDNDGTMVKGDLRLDARHRSEKSVARKDIIIGVGTIASGVASSLMNEKKHDPNVPKKKGIAGIIESMKENPLSIAGAGYLVSTFVHLISSIQEFTSIRNDNKVYAEKARLENKDFKPFPTRHTVFRLLFVVMNLIAETGMLFTSKGHGEGVRNDSSLDKTATAMAATLIQRQPKEKHEELIKGMAKELSNASAIAHPVAKVEEWIREQMSNLEKNPWAPVINKDLSNAIRTTSVAVAPELLTQPVAERLDVKQPQTAPLHAEKIAANVAEKTNEKPASSFGIAPRSKAPIVQTSLLERAIAVNENGTVAAIQ